MLWKRIKDNYRLFNVSPHHLIFFLIAPFYFACGVQNPRHRRWSSQLNLDRMAPNVRNYCLFSRILLPLWNFCIFDWDPRIKIWMRRVQRRKCVCVHVWSMYNFMCVIIGFLHYSLNKYFVRDDIDYSWHEKFWTDLMKHSRRASIVKWKLQDVHNLLE